MKLFKKGLSVFVATSMVLSFASCGKKEVSTDDVVSAADSFSKSLIDLNAKKLLKVCDEDTNEDDIEEALDFDSRFDDDVCDIYSSIADTLEYEIDEDSVKVKKDTATVDVVFTVADYDSLEGTYDSFDEFLDELDDADTIEIEVTIELVSDDDAWLVSNASDVIDDVLEFVEADFSIEEAIIAPLETETPVETEAPVDIPEPTVTDRPANIDEQLYVGSIDYTDAFITQLGSPFEPNGNLYIVLDLVLNGDTATLSFNPDEYVDNIIDFVISNIDNLMIESSGITAQEAADMLGMTMDELNEYFAEAIVTQIDVSQFDNASTTGTYSIEGDTIYITFPSNSLTGTINGNYISIDVSMVEGFSEFAQDGAINFQRVN